MTDTTDTLPDRFAAMISWQCSALDGWLRRGLLSLFFATAIATRLRKLGGRFASVVARLEAGTLPPPRPRAPQSPSGEPSPPTHPNILPRTFGWLRKWLPAGTAQLGDLLRDPEMEALVARAPQAGRALRPLCRMFGLRRPSYLRRPRRPREPRARKPINVDKLSALAYGNLIHPDDRPDPTGWRPPNRIGYSRGYRPPKKG